MPACGQIATSSLRVARCRSRIADDDADDACRAIQALRCSTMEHEINYLTALGYVLYYS